MNRTRVLRNVVVTLIVLFATVSQTRAQDETRYYAGAQLGALFSPGVTMTGDSNDRASICDEFINPLFASVPGCTDAARGVGDNWNVPFDGARGFLASAVVGYRIHRMLRVEAEYVLRSTNYGQRSGVLSAQGVNAEKLSDELFLAQEWLGTVSSRGLMGNALVDVPGISSRLTPYVGLGLGLGSTRADYGSVWSRNTDPAAIATGRDQPNAEQIARNLAGTSSSAQASMKDSHLSFQLFVGFDYPVRDAVSVDVRARWTMSNEFVGTVVWDPLRSHVPNLRRDGSEPVDGKMSTSDFSFVGVSVGMKYHF